MSIPSGEWVTISGVKKYIKISFFKSLRFRITFLIIVAGLIPGLIMRGVILNRYEDRAVELRTAEIQNQCAILCDQLSSLGYSGGAASEIIQTELTQLTNIYNGRVMIINEEYQIVEDTYDMDVGRTIVSGDVIRCFRKESTSHYDGQNRYIEVTSPITDHASEKVTGVLLMSVSTDVIVDQQNVLAGQTWVTWGATSLVVVILAFLAGMVMVRPFRRITRSIEAVTEGYEDQYLHEDACTETKLISEAFNKMLGRMKVLDDSRQEFVSNVSHELKTPLTSMKVLADSLLIQEDAPVELYKEFMGDLSEEIERENKIVNDLLSLVKMDKTANVMNIRSENINELVERIL